MLTKAGSGEAEDAEEPPESVTLEVRSGSEDETQAIEWIQPRNLEDEPRHNIASILA